MEKYRVVKKVYTNYVQLEEDPGSLQNAVSDVSKRVVREWEEPSLISLKDITQYAMRFVSYLSRYDDPSAEYWFYLEKQNSEGEWSFIASLPFFH
jgi:hypothetical protein